MSTPINTYVQKQRRTVQARIAEAMETVQSASGPMVAEAGDFIILGTQQDGVTPDHYPVKPAEFHARYELVLA